MTEDIADELQTELDKKAEEGGGIVYSRPIEEVNDEIEATKTARTESFVEPNDEPPAAHGSPEVLVEDPEPESD